MKKIERVLFVVTLFSLFSFLFLGAAAQAQDTDKICPQTVKNLQVRIKGLQNVYKGMHTDISSPLPASPIGRYNRHVNILVSNLSREIKHVKTLLEKVKDRKCQDIEKKLSPHIQKLQKTHTSLEAAVFDSDGKNYKIFVEILGGQVKDISAELKKH